MDDSFFVGGRQSVRDLHSVFGRLAKGKGPAAQNLAQCLALQELRDYVGQTCVRSHLINDEDVGMIQRGGSPSFLLKAQKAILVRRQKRRQDLDRDVPVETRIARAI